MQAELEERFIQQWEVATSPPCLAEFITSTGCVSQSAILALIEIDREFRKETQQTQPLDFYIEQLSTIADDADESIARVIEQLSGAHEAGQLSGYVSMEQTLKLALDQLHSPELQRQLEENEKTQSHINTELVREEYIGRYRLIRVLGKGAFGQVFLGVDSELQRQVAIKSPAPERFRRSEDAASFLDEARTVARLDHPHIVPVYDVGTTDEGAVYVVSKFIEGATLKEHIEQGEITVDQITRWLISVAKALEHAHQHRVVHRDVKPANILIEERTGEAYLADFGLAAREDDFLAAGMAAGTPAYMSPEQARGEGHRLDGRSDLFSLGIVLYELLTGQRPFRGETANRLLHQIVSVEPEPPRRLKPELPQELERICLKALSKRNGQRYGSATELVADLANWNQGDTRSDTWRIVPKGLRAYDRTDAEFFLELLPGPRDRDGLPECIRFWKTRIESLESDNTFSVGLLFGPSGCGKSSLVKAGILPQLASHVDAIYVEATADDTEVRIERGLRKACPDLPADLSLVEAFAYLRKLNDGRKRLVIVDQLEQWLHAHEPSRDTELILSLRQCDGAHLQTLLTVRDDFGMAATRLMQELDVAIVQGENFATVDLFDQQHAARVLVRFGQAFGKLPPPPAALSSEQQAFVETVVGSLAVDSRVVSVQLALFAEMVKDKSWETKTLQAIGGTQGIGVHFLEESLGARASNPSHRAHEQAARNVLQALLPELGTDIKGHMRSGASLLEVSGYQQIPSRFAELLRILDGELRLLTPTDPAGHSSESGSDSQEKHYQLTHDYLVRPLRQWLTQQKLQSRRGRAELRLAERSALWTSHPERRYLPSFSEQLSFLLLTRPQHRSPAAKAMLKSANRFYGIATMAVLLVGLGAAWGGKAWMARSEAQSLVENGLLTSSLADLPAVLRRLEPLRAEVEPLLEANQDSDDKFVDMKVGLALLGSQEGDPLPIIEQWLLTAESPEAHSIPRDVLIEHLTAHGDVAEVATARRRLSERFWHVASNEQEADDARLRAACTLAALDPDNAAWHQVAPALARPLVEEDPAYVEGWARLLLPVADHMHDPLARTVGQAQASPLARQMAVSALAKVLAADQPEILFELMCKGDLTYFDQLLKAIRAYPSQAVKVASDALVGQDESDGQTNAQDVTLAASLLLAHLAPEKFPWSLLRASSDPSQRNALIHALAEAQVDSQLLSERYLSERDAAVQSAILLALGDYRSTDLAAGQRKRLLEAVAHDFQYNAHAGLHSAAQYLLERWQQQDQLSALVQQLALSANPIYRPATGEPTEATWFHTADGLTFAALDFDDPSPQQAEGREADQAGERMRIAISINEVSRSQWLRFSKQNSDVVAGDHSGLDDRLPTMDCPMAGITFFEAAQYCNWLSQEEGIDQAQWCYEPNAEGKFAAGMLVKPNFRQLQGYRLPTEAEWKAACKAGTTTLREFGSDADLLPQYAWCSSNSQGRAWPVARLKPNGWGLFDMLGNIVEWCHRNPDSDKSLAAEEEVAEAEPEDSKDNEIEVELGGELTEDGSVIITAESRLPMCGGAYSHPIHETLPDHVFNTLGANRNTSVGLRPARTLSIGKQRQK